MAVPNRTMQSKFWVNGYILHQSVTSAPTGMETWPSVTVGKQQKSKDHRFGAASISNMKVWLFVCKVEPPQKNTSPYKRCSLSTWNKVALLVTRIMLLTAIWLVDDKSSVTTQAQYSFSYLILIITYAQCNTLGVRRTLKGSEVAT